MYTVKILVSTFGGDGGKSGISQYIMQMLKHFPMVAPDWQWDVLLRKEEEHLLIPDFARMRPLYFGSKLRNPIANIAWQQFALPAICTRGGYDAIFLPAGNRRLPFWTPCPRVGTFHDLAVRHVRAKYDTLHSLYNLQVLPILARRLSLVITVSESTKTDLLEYVRIPEKRIIVIPEAADTEHFYPHNKAQASKYISEKYTIRLPYLLYLSRIEHPGKNHVRLIKAFERLKENENVPHQLVLAGSDWPGAEEVHRVAEASTCRDDIVFTGFFPTADLPQLYCGADLFVFPSLFEGFGLPILEAMACGTPVACSNVSSMPEVAGRAALLFDPGEEKAIFSSMLRILTDSNLREEYANLGLVRSREFSWAETAKQTVEAIRSVVKKI